MCDSGWRAGKSRKKSGTSRKKRRDIPKKHTQLENDVLADRLGVRSSYLVEKKHMEAENGLRPNNYSAGERLVCRNVREKPQERPEKHSLSVEGSGLPNDALADPLCARGSNLAQTKNNEAENDSV